MSAHKAMAQKKPRGISIQIRSIGKQGVFILLVLMLMLPLMSAAAFADEGETEGSPVEMIAGESDAAEGTSDNQGAPFAATGPVTATDPTTSTDPATTTDPIASTDPAATTTDPALAAGPLAPADSTNPAAPAAATGTPANTNSNAAAGSTVTIPDTQVPLAAAPPNSNKGLSPLTILLITIGVCFVIGAYCIFRKPKLDDDDDDDEFEAIEFK